MSNLSLKILGCLIPLYHFPLFDNTGDLVLIYFPSHLFYLVIDSPQLFFRLLSALHLILIKRAELKIYLQGLNFIDYQNWVEVLHHLVMEYLMIVGYMKVVWVDGLVFIAEFCEALGLCG